MFKFLVFLAIAAALVMVHFSGLDNPRLERLGGGELRIHSREQIQSPLVERMYQNALGFTYVTRSENARELRQKFDVIDGESFVPDEKMSVNRILGILGHQVVDRQENNIMQVVYAYSGRARDFIMSGSRRVNLQIATRDGRVTVGWPVILGSF